MINYKTVILLAMPTIRLIMVNEVLTGTWINVYAITDTHTKLDAYMKMLH